MQNQLSKAINLVKKTGDKIIIFEGVNCETAYTVMSLDDYEKIILGRSEVRGLTENELFDKINRDIAVWKSQQNELSANEEYGSRNFVKNHSPYKEFEMEPEDFLSDDLEDWDFESEDEDNDDNDEESLDEDLYYYEEKDSFPEFIPQDNEKDEIENVSNNRKSIWQIPSEIKEGAEEIIEKKF